MRIRFGKHNSTSATHRLHATWSQPLLVPLHSPILAVTIRHWLLPKDMVFRRSCGCDGWKRHHTRSGRPFCGGCYLTGRTKSRVP